MGEILQSLKAVVVARPITVSPVVIRRNNLIKTIHEQIEAAKAKAAGNRYSINQVRRLKNKETGETIEQSRERFVREAWWVGNDGKVYLQVRYAWKPIEIAKGKSTIEVGDMSNLLPVLEKLRMAAEAGEFDAQLNEASSRLAQQLKARRSARK
jgi:hypothetical protein